MRKFATLRKALLRQINMFVNDICWYSELIKVDLYIRNTEGRQVLNGVCTSGGLAGIPELEDIKTRHDITIHWDISHLSKRNCVTEYVDTSNWR